jgi:transcriptional regulator with XRE-family HTH domain
MSLGSWISEQRTKRGLSQRALGDLVGVNQGTVSRWENGRYKPSAQERAKLQEVFEADLVWVSFP